MNVYMNSLNTAKKYQFKFELQELEEVIAVVPEITACKLLNTSWFVKVAVTDKNLRFVVENINKQHDAKLTIYYGPIRDTFTILNLKAIPEYVEFDQLDYNEEELLTMTINLKVSELSIED